MMAAITFGGFATDERILAPEGTALRRVGSRRHRSWANGASWATTRLPAGG